MDASRIAKPHEFLTPKVRLINNIKESTWLILNHKADSFRLLNNSENNPKDEYSLSTDETVSSLDINLPSIQHETIKHSSNFLNDSSPILNTSDSDSDNSYSSALHEFHSNSLPKVADKGASSPKTKINFISAPKHIQR